MLKDLTIALDMMGGDYGPRSSIPAAVCAVNAHANLTLILMGFGANFMSFHCLESPGKSWFPKTT